MTNRDRSRKIFDCFIFYNELDLLEIRLNTLSELVDYFVLVESTVTFTGKPKPLFYENNKARFKDFHDRIIHVIVDDMPEVVESTFVREEFQRSAIGRGLAGAEPDDLIIVSDADEIPKPDVLRAALDDPAGKITYFEGVYYHFFLNWRLIGRKDLMTSRMIEFRHFRDGWLSYTTKGCRSKSAPGWVEHLMWLPYAAVRHRAILRRRVCREGCWHFSFAMDPDTIRQKISAYKPADRPAQKNLEPGKVEERMAQRRSMFGNEIAVAPLDELPEYVQRNTQRFEKLVDLESVST